MSPGREVNLFIDFLKSMLDRIAVYEISEIDYRICIHFHTEAFLIVIEPCTSVKQAFWNIPNASGKTSQVDFVVCDLPV